MRTCRIIGLYQSSDCLTDDSPSAMGERHDLPGLFDECIPGVAAVTDDIVEALEHAVGQPVLTHELPDVLLSIQLG